MYFRWPFHLFALICASFCEKCFLIRCAPRPRWEAHFRRTIFARIVCKTMFTYPNWLQNHHFRGAFPPCAVQKMLVFADWAETGSPGMLSFASLLISCILDRIFERNKHHSMPQWCKRGSLSAFPRSLLQEHPLKLQCTRGHLLPLFTSVSAAFESALFTGRSGRSRIASAKTSVRSSMRSS